MMKKLMIKNWLSGVGRVFFGPLRFFFRWVKYKFAPPLKVSLTRQSIMILLPANQGGRLHILPRPGGASGLLRTFEVLRDGDGYSLKASPDNQVLASYPNELEAALALRTLNKALTVNPLWKWGVRLFMVWLAWLFVTSYMEVSQRQAQAANQPDVLGYGTTSAAPVIPSEPAPYQAIPSVRGPDDSDLSNYIYQQAMKAQKDALPPKVGVDNPAGLAAFGLKADGNGSGEGCDPKLAFKAPEK